MTRQEALEYLNLSDSASDRLVRKRYLELHHDYQKAISNAPSDHFRSLYRENLDKIEEAYLLIKETSPKVVVPLATDGPPPAHIETKIKDAQELIESLKSQSALNQDAVDPATQKQILGYIDQISQLQEFLQDEQAREEEGEPATSAAPALEVEGSVATAFSALPNPQTIETEEQDIPEEASTTEETVIDTQENSNGLPEQEVTEESEGAQVQTPEEPQVQPVKDSLSREPLHTSAKLKKTHLNRSRSFNRLLLGSIFLVLMAGMGGVFYMVYPVFFPDSSPPEGQLVPVEAEAPDKSIPHIVGDEFFRTGNYLEALLQYTLAIAEDPQNSYLQQQIDSCKALLAKQPELQEGTLLTEQPSTFTAPGTSSQPTTNNEANRFRGDEAEASQEITWNQSVETGDNPEPVAGTDLADNATISPEPPDIKDSALTTTTNDLEAQMMEEEEDWDRDKIWSIVDENPEPIGGYARFAQFTAERIKYPIQAYKAQVSGIVIVQFVVHKDGTTTGENVVKGIGYGCDEEALRVVKEFSGWMPGKKEGEIVHTKVAVPIYFKLD